MYSFLPLIVALLDFCRHNWPDLVGSWGSDFLWHVKVKTITTTTRSKQNAFWKGIFSIMYGNLYLPIIVRDIDFIWDH